MTNKPDNLTKSKNNQSSNSQLAITAYGLKTITGNQDFALFGAVATLLATATEETTQDVPARDGEGYNPALTAPIHGVDEIEPHLRMQQYLLSVIFDATAHLLDKHLEEKNHLLLIVVPASNFARSDLVDTMQWQESLSLGLAEFTNLKYQFLNADDNVTKQLQTACAALNDGKKESVIFAGIDSLINEATYQELIEQNRLCSSTISDAVIPGEAAACVIIQRINSNSTIPRAIIKALTHAPEHNSGKAHTSKMTGLSTAIHNASQLAQQHPDNIDCVIRNNTREQQYGLEWYQTTQTLWPNKLPEQERIAYQLGELNEPPKLKPRKMPEELFTGITLGEIGAATIPTSLILACARFDFNYPMVKNCLICEANEFPFRGAILLENPQQVTPSKP